MIPRTCRASVILRVMITSSDGCRSTCQTGVRRLQAQRDVPLQLDPPHTAIERHFSISTHAEIATIHKSWGTVNLEVL